MSSTDLLIGAGWSPLDLRVAPLAGASVGLSERAYAAHGVALTHFQTTLARLELGVAFALSDRWSLAAGVAVSADLFSTYLSLSDGTTLLLPRVQGAGSLSLRVHFP